MSPLSQVLSNKLPSWPTIKATTFFLGKQVYFVGGNFLTQRFFLYLRSFHSNLPPLDPSKVLDLSAMSCLKALAERCVIPNSFKDNQVFLSVLSNAFALSTISAYKFYSDPSFTISSFILLSSSLGINTYFANFYDSIVNKDLWEKALVTRNVELGQKVLEKNKTFCINSWKSIFEKIYFQNTVGPTGISIMFEPSFNASDPIFINNNPLMKIFDEDNLHFFEVLWRFANNSIKSRGNIIFKYALRTSSKKISKFLFEQGVRIPELDKVCNAFNLTLGNLLPVFLLKPNKPPQIENLLHPLKIKNEKDIQKKIQIDLYQVLYELLKNNCVIIEMVIYLALQDKEGLNKEDIFHLHPIDYSIIFKKPLKNLFDFIIDSNVNFTLGNPLCLHLACYLNEEEIVSTLLKKCDQFFSKVKPQKHLFNMLPKDHSKIHRTLFWGKTAFINAYSSLGLTPLHYAVLNRNISPRIIALMFKAGARDIKGGPFIRLTLISNNSGNNLLGASEEQLKIKLPPFPGLLHKSLEKRKT